MTLRSAFLSPPAVAGFALLALVVGTIFGVRSTMNNGGDTEVAGTVIERSEPAEVETDDASPAPIVPDLVIDPEPTEPAEPPVLVQPDTDPVEVVEAPQQPPGGLIPDPDGPTVPQDDDDDQPTQPRPRNPRPQPEPEPTRAPRPDPEPEPEPTEDPRQYALRTGEGHSVHVAESWGDHWEFRTTEPHSGGRSDRPRTAATRLAVALTPASVRADASQFQCAAWLNAGDRRLTTDADHYFRVTLVELDENFEPTGNDHSVLHQQVYDLAAEETTSQRPMRTEMVDVDPANGFSYTCTAAYVSKN